MAGISIEIRYADRPAEIREFSQAKVKVGRETGDIVLGDPACSGHHAEINITQTNVTFVDLSSTNGSFGADGQRLSGPLAMSVGTQVRIGGSWLILRAFEAGAQRYGAQGTLLMPEAEVGPTGGVNPAQPQPGAAPDPMAFADTVNPGAAASPFMAQAAAAVGAQAAQSAAAAGAQPQQGGAPSAAGQAPPGAPPQMPHQSPHQHAAQHPAPQHQHSPPLPGANGVTPAFEPGAFVASAMDVFKPHLIEAIKVIGIIAIPLGLVSAVGTLLGGVAELLSMLVVAIGNIGFLLAYLLVGVGAQAEFSMRLAAGAPITATQAWKAQLKRVFPWLVGVLVPWILASIGTLFCIVPGILIGFYLFQIYMVERDKTLVDINKRCFELVSKEPLAVVTVVGLAIAAILASVLVSFVLGLLPWVGPALAALWSPVFSALLTPLITFLSFRAYFDVRQRHEGVDAASIVRSRLGAP